MSSETVTLGGAAAEGEALDLLLRRAQTGEEAAFEEILSRFESKAIFIARALGATRDDAEDIAQDAFLRLFKSVGSYQGGRRFTSWFYRIVVNAARDHLGRLGPAAPSGPADSPEGGARGGREAPSTEASPDAGLLEEERREQVRLALMRLSDREREVIVLRDLQGLTTWETARALGLNPITVRRHAMRARVRLKEILGG